MTEEFKEIVNRFINSLKKHKFYEKPLDARIKLFNSIYDLTLSNADRNHIPGYTNDLRKYELSSLIGDYQVYSHFAKNVNPKKEKKDDEFLLVIANNTQPDNYLNFIQNITDKKVVLIDHKEINDYRSKDIDLILFTGGEDVNPKLYNENIGKYTGISETRDILEQDIFNTFYNVPKLGICRGSQFLTVMAGGKLIQHVENHTRQHAIHMYDESFVLNDHIPLKEYNVTSTHHQMMYPFNLEKENYEIIGFSKFYLSETYLNGDNEEIKKPSDFVECEIVYYPNTKSLCIQAHPEYMDEKDNFVKTIIKLIKEKLLKNE